MALHIVTFRKEGVDWNCNSRILLACYQVTFRKEGVDWNSIMNLVLTASGVTFRKEGVDWNSKRHTLTSQEQNVTFRKEGVDWNNRQWVWISQSAQVTFRKEGVDWNWIKKSRLTMCSASPSARKVWIEIIIPILGFIVAASHLPQGRCGLKYFYNHVYCYQAASPSARKVWIEIAHQG